MGRRSLLAAGAVAALGLAPGPAVAEITPFTEEALRRGLDFPMTPNPQQQGYLGQGVAFVDLDSDGDSDVVILGAPGAQNTRPGIFENLGQGAFLDRTGSSGIPTGTGWGGIAAADYDSDGLIDLFFTKFEAANTLVRNMGGLTFSDVTTQAGVGGGVDTNTGAAWGDYNNDGWVDLYVCRYIGANALYRNNGNGTFANVADVLGVGAPDGLSFQAVWSDYDRDGDVDLYLSNDRAPLGYAANMLWDNPGDGSAFTDVSAASGADVAIYSMGIGAGDADANGYPDYYLTNVNTAGTTGQGKEYDGINPLLLNQGDGTFVESAEAAGVDDRRWSWGATFFDFDNDYNTDLYVNNQFFPNALFHNPGSFPWDEVAQEAGVEASYDPTYVVGGPLPWTASFCSTVADVDGDGDVDLLVNNPGYRAELFINHEGDERNYVRLVVVGQPPNRNAIGASVLTTLAGKKQFQEVYAGGNGYLSQNEFAVQVGLDQAATLDEAVVRWPANGASRTLTGLPANHTWTIYHPTRLCDGEGDGDKDYNDLMAFSSCFKSGLVDDATIAACEMMDHDGDSSLGTDDLTSCFSSGAADCNGNGTQDLTEIILDFGIDLNQDKTIDCCSPGPAKEPNPVGPTLKLTKTPAGQPLLTWDAPAPDATHNAASRYDVFRALDGAQGPFFPVAQPSSPSYVDLAVQGSAYYLVGARNNCGSSGEEPF